MELTSDLHDWLLAAVKRNASDLHLLAGYGPNLRLHGRLEQLQAPPLRDEDLRANLLERLPPEQRVRFESEYNLDYAFTAVVGGTLRRFRANLFLHSGTLGCCIRLVPDRIPELAWAGFPSDLADRLTHFRNGLVLVAGVTGAGKTTTLAMLIQMLNEEGGSRILTVEDPVEYEFPRCAHSIISQREVGRDVRSFADGLKYGLRQDPDIILVGEIRDRDTAQTALSAAETGHLVFSTLHTRDAKGALSRFLDLFPQSVQGEIRSQLSMSLRAVVSQHLLPSARPDMKRELALEVMLNNTPISSAIRQGRLETIDTNIQTGRADGMVSLDESVRRLLAAGRISRETAEQFTAR